MKIVVQHTDGCPNVTVAQTRAREALDRLNLNATIECVLIRTTEDAERTGFVGSPTLLIDGFDPFPRGDAPALACRMYRTSLGLEGAPSVEQIAMALSGHTR